MKVILIIVVAFFLVLSANAKSTYSILKLDIYANKLDTNFIKEQEESYVLNGKGEIYFNFVIKNNTVKIPFSFTRSSPIVGFSDTISPFYFNDHQYYVTLYFRCIKEEDGVFSIINEYSNKTIHIMKKEGMKEYSLHNFFRKHTITLSVKGECREVIKYNRGRMKITNLSEYCNVDYDYLFIEKERIKLMLFEDNKFLILSIED